MEKIIQILKKSILFLLSVFFITNLFAQIDPMKDLMTGWSQELIYESEVIGAESICMDDLDNLFILDKNKVEVLLFDTNDSLYSFYKLPDKRFEFITYQSSYKTKIIIIRPSV